MGVFLVYGFMSCFWYMDYEILVLSIYSESVRERAGELFGLFNELVGSYVYSSLKSVIVHRRL